MRINKYVAAATGLSRRTADKLIEDGKVLVNGVAPTAGQDIGQDDTVTMGSRQLQAPAVQQTILLNKPAGYVVSRDGQGSQTVYDLLPRQLHHLKPIGRLDKNSSGLLLMTTDGQLAQELTHPWHQKTKVYEVTLNTPLTATHKTTITETGVMLQDGPSRFILTPLDTAGRRWTVTMHEGRNRQIRRTFEALGYSVKKLHRTHFGDYALRGQPGEYTQL